RDERRPGAAAGQQARAGPGRRSSKSRGLGLPRGLSLPGDGDDGGRLGALLTLAGLELDPGPFVELLVALAGDLREVDEQVLAALVRRDEHVSLRSVEPLDGTGCHGNTSSCHSRTGREGARLAAFGT